MARIRTIKPEFWTSEQVMECSPTARLLFVGMWNFCDDGGNHPASAKTLKAEVFPADDFTADSIQGMVDELVAQGLLLPYEADGKRFLHVTGWHHQKIEKPNFKHPSPTNLSTIADHSPTNRRPVADHSTTEGKGMEGKGKEVHQAASTTEPEERESEELAAADSSLMPEPEPERSANPEILPAMPPDPIHVRSVEITVMLRQRGASLQSSDPRVRRWAEEGVTDAQALQALEIAQQRREERGSHQPIGSGYLDSILADEAQAPKARASPGHISRDQSRSIAAQTNLSDFLNDDGTPKGQPHDPRTINADAPRLVG